MQRKHWILGITLIALAAMLVPMVGQVNAQVATSGNLLVNGDFEDGDYHTGWKFQDNIPEVQVAPGWRAFYVDAPPDYVRKPVSCENAHTGCYWARPEFRDVRAAEFEYRIQSGVRAQKYFTFGRQHEAGMMQQVSGIQPGTPLMFQAFVMLWSCMAGEDWNYCPTNPNSNSPMPMHARVGIDPTGGTNPWAPSVIWSGENNTIYDTYVPLQIAAVAQASQVTVFVYTRADWVDLIPRLHNDVYVDNASLVTMDRMPGGAPVVQPAAAKTTSATSSSTSSTTGAKPTRIPDAVRAQSKIYVVQKGDTLSKIARTQGVSLGQLRRFNVLRTGDKLYVGDELIITSTYKFPATTPAAAATTAAKTTPAPTTSSSSSSKLLRVPDSMRAQSKIYVVQAGDTLSKIAKAQGVSINQLRSLNTLRPNDLLYVGDELILSTTAQAPKVTATPTPKSTATPKPATTPTPTPKPSN